jgi:hypothetical protein
MELNSENIDNLFFDEATSMKYSFFLNIKRILAEILFDFITEPKIK